MNRIKDDNIVLHICPSSNVVLGAVSSIKQHPIKTLYKHGIRVTINTDDLLLFNSSVSEEYLKLYQAGVLTGEELDDIRLYSLKL